MSCSVRQRVRWPMMKGCCRLCPHMYDQPGSSAPAGGRNTPGTYKSPNAADVRKGSVGSVLLHDWATILRTNGSRFSRSWICCFGVSRLISSTVFNILHGEPDVPSGRSTVPLLGRPPEGSRNVRLPCCLCSMHPSFMVFKPSPSFFDFAESVRWSAVWTRCPLQPARPLARMPGCFARFDRFKPLGTLSTNECA